MTDNTSQGAGAAMAPAKRPASRAKNSSSKTRSHAKKNSQRGTPQNNGGLSFDPEEATRFDTQMDGYEGVWNRYVTAQKGANDGTTTIREVRAYGYQIQAQNRGRLEKATAKTRAAGS